jgi:hypothetical protein
VRHKPLVKLVRSCGDLHAGRENDAGFHHLLYAVVEGRDRPVLVGAKPVVTVSTERLETNSTVEPATEYEVLIRGGRRELASSAPPIEIPHRLRRDVVVCQFRVAATKRTWSVSAMDRLNEAVRPPTRLWWSDNHASNLSGSAKNISHNRPGEVPILRLIHSKNDHLGPSQGQRRRHSANGHMG